MNFIVSFWKPCYIKILTSKLKFYIASHLQYALIKLLEKLHEIERLIDLTPKYFKHADI